MPKILESDDPIYCLVDEKLAEHDSGRYRTHVSEAIKENVLKLLQEARADLSGIHGTTIHCCVDDELIKDYFYRIKDAYFPTGVNILDDYTAARDGIIVIAKSEKKQDGSFVVYPNGTIKDGYIFTANFNILDHSFNTDFRDLEEKIFKNRDEGGTRTKNALAAACVLVGGYIGLLRTYNGLYIFENNNGILTLPFFEGNSGVDPNTRIDTNKLAPRKELEFIASQ